MSGGWKHQLLIDLFDLQHTALVLSHYIKLTSDPWTPGNTTATRRRDPVTGQTVRDSVQQLGPRVT
jgi:hypothetical protein